MLNPPFLFLISADKVRNKKDNSGSSGATRLSAAQWSDHATEAAEPKSTPG